MTRSTVSRGARRLRVEDVDDRARLLAGRDLRQMHFAFYLAITASLDPPRREPQALRAEHKERKPKRTA
jgi:hypothetical protein